MWRIMHTGEVVSRIQFPDAWKGGIMCGVPRKPGVPMTLEQSCGILVSTPNSTLNKRVAPAVEKTSKPWQIGKKQQRPAAILFADLKGAFYHALQEQIVGPCFSEAELLAFFPSGRRRISLNT